MSAGTDAAVIRYDLQGTVVTPDPVFGSLQLGQPFTAWFSYDDDSTSNPDQSSDPTIGNYELLAFIIEGNAILPDGVNPPIAVLNDFAYFGPPPIDGLAINGMVPGPIVGTGSSYSVILYGPSASLFSSDALTDVGAGRTVDSFNLMQLRRIANPSDPWPGNILFGTIQSISGTVVPEPSPLAVWNVDSDGNWSAAGNWTGGAANAAGARAVFGGLATAPRTVAVDVPITVGRIDFDNAHAYTIAGASALTLDATSGSAEINVTGGSHTISAPLTLADNAVISVSLATGNLSITGGLNAAGLSLTKAGAGTLTVNHLRAAELSIDGGKVVLSPSGSAGASVVGALSIAGDAAPTATLDLTGNAVVLDYSGASPAVTVRQQLLAGRGGSGFGGSWTGTGIASSEAATVNATQPESRSIGYAENADLPLGALTEFHGAPVDNTSILIAFTRTGDANLDGIVNDDDVTIVGAMYAPGVPNPHWALGDFDYNGFVDDDDVTLLGVFFNPSAAPLIAPPPAAEGATIRAAAVPEPSSAVLLLLACGTLLWGCKRGER